MGSKHSIERKYAMRFIIIIGLVSLFADMTYEGGRSITGPYLAFLGASAALVGLVAGLGELAGYGLRLVSGYLSSRTGKNWFAAFIGYTLNVLTIPMLAIAPNWEVASILIVGERAGKAIRTPARDTMLSKAAVHTGQGFGFGIHEALDQAGAFIGPLIVAFALYIGGGYFYGFGILLIPALSSLMLLTIAWKGARSEQRYESNIRGAMKINYGKPFFLYLIFVTLSLLGYAHFQIISYHLYVGSVIPQEQIPVIFAIAMGADAISALLIGKGFDKLGPIVLITAPLISLPIAFLVFSYSPALVLIGMLLWGIVLGIQETILKAFVAEITKDEIRAFAYGIFDSVFGFAWFIGSVLMGVIYEYSIALLIILSVTFELLSIPFVLLLIRRYVRA